MTFQSPLALTLIVPLAIICICRRQAARSIHLPALSELTTLPQTFRQRVRGSLPLLRGMALALSVISLARPQMVNTESTVTSKGVDIVLALDHSTSMLAVDRTGPDHSRSRLVIAKEVTRDFIARRTGDRIALVAFAARPYPAAPLTLDHDWLSRVLDNLEPSSMEDGTAIGDAILSAVNRIRNSSAASRSIVLITDGRSNAGKVTPPVAAAAASSLGIRVHTIGIGSRGAAAFPVEDPLGGTIWRMIPADLDEKTLEEISATTGGRYFRADDRDRLRAVFTEIDRLEKQSFIEKRKQARKELFPPLILAALLVLLIERTLSTTWLRSIP